MLSFSRRIRALGVALTLPATGAALAQSTEAPYQIPYTTSVPLIDGIVAPGEWDDALEIELTNETHPVENVPAPVATRVLMMEDGASFMLAFIASDPEPDKIRAYYRDRDSAWQDDMVGIVIDTFNDERRAFEFFVNPLGAQMDAVQDDVARREDSSWNAIWDSAGQINDTGFVVEIRIPLNQLRFPSGLVRQTWGIDILRFYPREARHRISNNLTDYARNCYLCLFRKAEGFANLTGGTNLRLIPTLTAMQTESRPDPATDPWQKDDANYEPSLDIRWGVNEDMVLNATLNPDFSQVETDQPQVDINNTFSLSYDERREFFLDGADYFNTPSNLVYTRNIFAPDYGLKLTGKSGNHSYGVLYANDERATFVIPGRLGSSIALLDDSPTDNVALRYRYDHGRSLTVGTLITDRETEGYGNTLISADMTWQIKPSDRLTAQIMTTDTDYPLSVQTDYSQAASLTGNAFQINYNHQGTHSRVNASYSDYSPDFRADLGFISQVDVRRLQINPNYVWRFNNSGFNAAFVFGQVSRSEDQDGIELEQGGTFGGGFDGPLQSHIETGVNIYERFYNGQYFDQKARYFFGQVQPWGGSQLRINVNAGTSIDYANSRPADVLTISPSVTFRLGRRFQTSLGITGQTLDVTGGQLYEIGLVDARFMWQYDERSFIRLILVASNTDRNPALYTFPVDRQSRSLTSQLLYSYRVNAQTRFFIGYSSNGIDNDNLDRLSDTDHAVFAKFSYAWQL